jgi:hypothetical protein
MMNDLRGTIVRLYLYKISFILVLPFTHWSPRLALLVGFSDGKYVFLVILCAWLWMRDEFSGFLKGSCFWLSENGWLLLRQSERELLFLLLLVGRYWVPRYLVQVPRYLLVPGTAATLAYCTREWTMEGALSCQKLSEEHFMIRDSGEGRRD